MADKTIQIQWNQTIVSDFAGWNVYISNESGVYDMENPFAFIPYSGTPETSYTTEQIVNAVGGTETTVYVIMTALDATGNESPISNEVLVVIDLESPDAPFILNIQVVSI